MSVTAQIKAVSQLAEQMQASGPNKDACAALAQNVQTLRSEFRAYEKDVAFFRMVASMAAAAGILVIVAIFMLVLKQATGIEALTAIGTTLAGALLGLMAPAHLGWSRSKDRDALS